MPTETWTTDRHPQFRAYGPRDIATLPQLRSFPRSQITAMRAVAAVLPFRANNYVVENLIRWEDVPGDRIFQLTFPQEGMLAPEDLGRMVNLLESGAPEAEVQRLARSIQARLNPHPSGQRDQNVPRLGGESLDGMQHKYPETVLFFPAQGQTCHAYCTYCFRWAQFAGLDELQFASREAQKLVTYLRAHPEVKSVLITGGDPLVMRTSVLRRYVEPLLDPSLELESIRLGTKALAYWPYRVLTDRDAPDLLRLFEEVRSAGLHLALMAHYSHPRELEPEPAQLAVRRVQDTGAVVRCQAPLIRHVNDRPQAWAEMWQRQTRLGAVPYYMFVERDTGAHQYFGVPLARALHIFGKAYRNVSGLARTVRGPSMSATPGKVLIDGVAKVGGQKVFVLKFLQARDPDWVGRPFFARFDAEARWLDDLEPAFGDERFFFEESHGQSSELVRT